MMALLELSTLEPAGISSRPTSGRLPNWVMSDSCTHRMISEGQPQYGLDVDRMTNAPERRLALSVSLSIP